MTTNINFSFGRLMAITKLDIVENWKTNLYRIIGLYCGITVAFIGSTSGYQGYQHTDAYSMFCDRVGGILFLMLLFYSTLCASSIMEIMKTKDMRIRYMMIPATIFEKFLSRVLYTTIIAGVFFIISTILGEMTRLAIFPLLDAPAELGRFCLFDIASERTNIINYSSDTYLIPNVFHYLMIISYIVWIHSIFMLGGSYFRKSPFLKTFGICIGASVLLGIISANSSLIIDLLYSAQDFLLDNETWFNGRTIGIYTTIAFTTFSVLHWWLSYRLFKNSQITERKLFK